MSTSITSPPPPPGPSRSIATGVLFGAVIALLVALIYLFIQVDRVQTDVANLQKSVQKDLLSLRESSSVTTATNRRNLETLSQELEAAKRQAAMAVGQAKTEAVKRAEVLTAQLAEEQRRQSAHVASQISEVKEATADAAKNIGEVKTDVGGVKTDLTATKAELEKTISELKSVRGDMGQMSGLIATNGKELNALIARGDRNYFKFDIRKTKAPQKVGDIAILVKKVDQKKNKFSIDVVADDKSVEKKDKGVNEPLQFYVSKASQPYELVVNQVGKDQIIGYLATPKVLTPRP